MTEVQSTPNYKFLGVISTPLLLTGAYKWCNNPSFTLIDGLMVAAACGGMYLGIRSCLHKRHVQPIHFSPDPIGFSPGITKLDPYIDYLKEVHRGVLLKTTGNLFQYVQNRQTGNTPRINQAQLKQEANEFLDCVLHHFDMGVDEPFSLEFARQLLDMGLDPCTSQTLLQTLTARTHRFPKLLDLFYFQHPTPEVALNQVYYRRRNYWTLLDILQKSREIDPALYDYDAIIEEVKQKGGLTFEDLRQKLRQSDQVSNEQFFSSSLKYSYAKLPLIVMLMAAKGHEYLDPLELIQLYAMETARRGSREWFKELFFIFNLPIQNPIGIFDEAIKTLAQAGFSFNELDRDGKTVLDFLLYQQRRAEGLQLNILKHPHHEALQAEAVATTIIEILKQYGAKKGEDVQNPRARYYPDYFSWSL